jgi:hypothetical protein
MRRQVDAWRRSSQARGVHPWFAPLLYASLSGPIRSTVPSTLPGPRSPPSAPRSPVSPSLFFSTTGGARHLSTVAVGCLFGLRTSSPTAVVLMALFSSAYAGDFGSNDEVLALAALGAPGAMCQELCASGHLTTGGVRGVYPWFIPAVLSGYGGYGGGGGQGRGGGRWGNHGRGQGSQPHAPPASEEAKAAFEAQLNASVAAYVEAAVTRDSEDEDAAPADGFVPKIFVKDARQRLGYRIGFCERPEDDCNEPTIEPRMRTWLMNNGRNAPAHIRPLPLFALLLEGLQLLGGDRRALSLLMVMLMNSFKRAGKRELERRQKREQDLKRDKFNMGWRSDDDDDFDPGSDGLGPRSRGGRGEGRREPQRERSRERDRGHRDRRPYGSTHTLAVWAVGVAALIADGTHPRRFKWR